MSKRRKTNGGDPRNRGAVLLGDAVEQRVKVKLTLPPDHPKHDTPAILTCLYRIVGNETRLSDFRDNIGRLVVDLPADVRFQLPNTVEVVGRLVVDDGVRIRRVGRSDEQN